MDPQCRPQKPMANIAIIGLLTAMFYSVHVLSPEPPSMGTGPAHVTNAEVTTPRASPPLETMVVAAGCYWSVELVFQRIPGVVRTDVGFCGGLGPQSESPVYPARGTGHAEAVRVEFDPKKVSYRTLVRAFFAMHDPFDGACQGPDCGSEYRSAVWPRGDAQLREVRLAIEALETGPKARRVATEVGDGHKFRFWPAHAAHQQYLEQKFGADASKGSVDPIRCYGNRGPLKRLDKPEILRALRPPHEPEL
jgi:peptide-methionine (S)-S-oxide reductase